MLKVEVLQDHVQWHAVVLIKLHVMRESYLKFIHVCSLQGTKLQMQVFSTSFYYCISRY